MCTTKPPSGRRRRSRPRRNPSLNSEDQRQGPTGSTTSSIKKEEAGTAPRVANSPPRTWDGRD
eukprot:15774740-Heterocapsa_arctica.AAC.1